MSRNKQAEADEGSLKQNNQKLQIGKFRGIPFVCNCISCSGSICAACQLHLVTPAQCRVCAISARFVHTARGFSNAKLANFAKERPKKEESGVLEEKTILCLHLLYRKLLDTDFNKDISIFNPTPRIPFYVCSFVRWSHFLPHLMRTHKHLMFEYAH